MVGMIDGKGFQAFYPLDVSFSPASLNLELHVSSAKALLSLLIGSTYRSIRIFINSIVLSAARS